jgi:hypothetical protein
MIISRKSIFRTVLLISLTIVTLVYGVTYLMDIEDANIYIKEINIDKCVRDINTLIIIEPMLMLKKALILRILPSSRIKAFFIFKNLREQAYKQKS